MSPLPSDEEIEAHYRTKFQNGNYEVLRRFADSYRTVYRGFLERIEARLQELGKSPQGLRLLEIGCFTGEFLSLAQTAGFKVSGYELQDAAVEEAQRILPGKVHKIDVHDSGLRGESCDVLCLFGVLEHVKDPKGLLARCTELLAPGGLLFIQTPDNSSFPSRILGRFWPPYAPVEHICLLSRAALRGQLNDLGYTDFQSSQHWKTLPVEYVFEMLRHFGPELRRAAEPFYRFIPRPIRTLALPFYIGEMFVSARKIPRK